MGADDDVDLAVGEVLEDRLLFFARFEAGELFHAHREAGETIGERAMMLRGEQGCRNEHGDLALLGDGLKGRAHGDFGLPVSDVAANEPVHRPRALHIGFDLGDRFGLVGRRLVGKRFFEFGLPRGVGSERASRGELALGV